jgi:hypothetical protein
VRDELNANQALGSASAHTIRFICSTSCGQGGECHGDALAAVAKRLIVARDERVAAQGPIKVRKVRSDKGVKRGPRRVTGGSEYRIGILSLYRYRYGMERQVSQATKAAVAAGLEAGVQPWLADGQAAIMEPAAAAAAAAAGCSATPKAHSDCMIVEDDYEDEGGLASVLVDGDESISGCGDENTGGRTDEGSATADGTDSSSKSTPRRRGSKKVTGRQRHTRTAASKRQQLRRQRVELLRFRDERDHDDINMDWLDDVHVGEVEEAEDLGWLDNVNAETTAAAGAAAADTDMTEAAESGMQLAAESESQSARAAAETVLTAAEAGSSGVDEAAAAVANAVMTETEAVAAVATPSRAGSSAEQAVSTPAAGSSGADSQGRRARGGKRKLNKFIGQSEQLPPGD